MSSLPIATVCLLLLMRPKPPSTMGHLPTLSQGHIESSLYILWTGNTPGRVERATMRVCSVIRPHWHSYAASLGALVPMFVSLWFHLLPQAGNAVVIAAATLTAFWSLSSLL